VQYGKAGGWGAVKLVAGLLAVAVAAGVALVPLVARLVSGAAAQARPTGGRENIVGLWQTDGGSIHLKSDGTYEGVVTEYATGRRQTFSGRYTYRSGSLKLGGERAHVHWHDENRITVTVVASPYEDYPRWQVTYTRKR
jgi:hypothetical protein